MRVCDSGESNDTWIAKEAETGKDELNYERYAEVLARLFRTGEIDNLPTAIGIYARWGDGKVLIILVLGESLRSIDVNKAGLTLLAS